jgi:recombination protein RecT
MSQSLTTQTFETELDSINPRIAAMLPPDVPLEKFRQVVLAAIRQKPDLLKCNQSSLFSACLNAAQDGLLPDGREGAIVPRKGIAVWQPMIGGIFKRLKSGGSVASLSANVVYDGEEFAVMLGDEDRIVHRRDVSLVRRGQEVAVYAIARLKDGTAEREIMTWEQVEAVRQASAMPNSGPWTDWPDEMARKTVIRRLSKRLPVLDPADEALQRTIQRVDALYDFDSKAAAITPPQTSQPPLKAAAAPMQRAPRRTEVEPVKPAPRKTHDETVRDDVIASYDAVRTRQEYLKNTDECLQTINWFAEKLPAFHAMIVKAQSAAWDRTEPRREDIAEWAGDLPEVEIVGGEKMAAG